MRRRLGMVCMLLATAALAAVMAARPQGAAPVEARIVTVSIGNVAVTVGLTGRLAYAQEYPALSTLPGQVAEVYVEPGQLVKAGQALVRLDGSAAEQAASAFAAQASDDALQQQLRALLQGTIIRAPEDGFVRQVLVAEHGVVGAGEAVALLSGSGQVIRCAVVERDARELRTGMEAVLLANGEELGRAYVESIGAVTAETSTGRLVCEVTLTPHMTLALPMGASVEVDVILQERRSVPVLPVEAVTERNTLWWVHDGICTEIPAEIVLSDEMYMMVPLAEGTAVAIGEFTEGQPVREATR